MKKITLIMLIAGFAAFVSACGNQESEATNNKELMSNAEMMTAEKKEASEDKMKSDMNTENQEAGKDAEASPVVVFETSMGNFEIELNTEAAPVSCENFLSYVDEGFYNGLIFHRVINNFMIQGGGFDKSMTQKPTKAAIVNEAGNGLMNDIYTVAMARTPVINSATSQFFINTKSNDFLNHRDQSAQGFGYAVFGKVISGMDVVDKINVVPTGVTAGMQDVPVTPVVILKAYRK